MSTDADDPAEDDGLRAMRSVWLSMREADAEPPARGMAELLAAARAHAAPRPEPAWRRALAVLVRPPVLAFATVVLVAGTAVLVKSHGGLQPDEAPVASAPVAVEQRARTVQVAPPPHSQDMAPAPAAAAQGEAVAPPAIAAPAPPPPPVHPKPAPAKSARVMDADRASLDESGADEARPTAAPLPVAPMPDVKASAAGAPAATGAGADLSPSALAAAARAAAVRGDCAAARKLLERLREADAKRYATALTDSAIATCR